MKTLKLHQLAVLCFLFGISGLYAQKTPYLERLVTVKAYNQPLAEIFRSLASQADVTFSYTNFNDQRKVTASHLQKPLRIVLNDLLKETNCSYKMKGRYVILQCSDKPKSESEPVHISGYVYNAKDSSRLESVSVYIRENRHSATTNKYGYFSFSFPRTAGTSRVSIARESFRDTTITISSRNKVELNIFLVPRQIHQEIYASIDPREPAIIPLEKDTVPVATPVGEVQLKRRIPVDTSFHNLLISGFNFWEKLKQKNLSMRNIDDTLFQNVSVSLVPYVSTNRLLSINTVNRYSFNLLVGQSKGVDVFEFGTLVNIDNGNVRYGQIAGLVNVVSGDVTGGQVAGLVNYNAGNTVAFQVGGLVNVVKGNARYVQIGGLGNVVNNDFEGLQVGGIFNQTRKMSGIQLSGISGVNDYTNGIQVSGIVSKAKRKMNGIQVGGLVNVADTVNGWQVAGLVNKSRVTNGFQVAGLVNSTKHLKGAQIGFMNFSRTCTGVPVGFFSYVHKGYHKIELAVDENIYGTFSFRTGVDHFHNIFIGGVNLQQPDRSYTFGYGLGTAIRMSPKWYFDLDVTGQHIQETRKQPYLNSHGKVFLGFEFRPLQKINIAFGPTYNVFVSQINQNNTLAFTYAPYDFFKYMTSDVRVQMWVGAKVCLRFL